MGNAPSGVSTVKLTEVPSGSVLLVRQCTDTQFGQLDPSIVRGIAAAQRGGMVSVQHQALASWTHCGLILERKGKRYIAQATSTGVQLLPASKHIRKLQTSGARVAVRRLCAPLDGSRTQVLNSLLHAAAAGCEWERYMPELARDAPGQSGAILLPFQAIRLPRLPLSVDDGATTSTGQVQSSPGYRSIHNDALQANPASLAVPPLATEPAFRSSLEVDSARDSASLASSARLSRPSATHRSAGGSSARSADLSPFARDLIRLIIPRIYGALQALPERTAMELRRSFAIVDRDNDGRWVGVEESFTTFQDLCVR
jgi:hypothetical protein